MARAACNFALRRSSSLPAPRQRADADLPHVSAVARCSNLLPGAAARRRPSRAQRLAPVRVNGRGAARFREVCIGHENMDHGEFGRAVVERSVRVRARSLSRRQLLPGYPYGMSPVLLRMVMLQAILKQDQFKLCAGARSCLPSAGSGCRCGRSRERGRSRAGSRGGRSSAARSAALFRV